MNRRHLVILGHGAAALKAAAAIGRQAREAPLTLVAEEPFPAYSRMLLPYYVSGRIEETGLFLRDKRFYQEMGIRLVEGRAARCLLPQQQRVGLADGSWIGYDQLLIATGAVPYRPLVPGIDGDNISALWSLEDARRIRAAQHKAGHIVILGAGLVGLQALAALFTAGRKITIVEMADGVLPRMLDAPAAGMVAAELRRRGVALFTGTTIVETSPSPHGKRKVRLGSGEEMECDWLLLAAGAGPNVDFLHGSGLKIGRGILVDSQMRTSIPHIYAAGDVAETRDLLTGESVVPGIWPVALEQGEVAGLNMAGANRESAGSLNLNILEVPGLVVASIGLTAPDSGMESLVFRDDSRRLYRRLILKGGRLVGAVLVGRIADVGILRNLVQRRADVAAGLASVARGALGLADLLLPLVGKKPLFP